MIQSSSHRFKEKGFNLIELLVVISIITIITGIILVNYKSGEDFFALKRSANKVAQDIRIAQQMSMSAKQINCGVDLGTIVPLGGYALSFTENETSYQTIPDCDGSNSLTASLGPAGESEEDFGIQNLLESGIIIKDVDLGTSLYFNFIPPIPKVCIAGGDCLVDEAFITLCISKQCNPGDPVINIIINNAGLIEQE